VETELPWRSIHIGSDSLHFQYCFEQDSKASFFIGIDAWLGGSYSMIASTAGTVSTFHQGERCP